jgi:hypothetical protein
MNDATLFMSALRAAVPTEPDSRLGAGLVPRLAEAARASTIEAETRATGRRPRSRLAAVVRVGIAVAAVPLVLAGLAFAGVTVPQAARTAFDSVGIELPNQPSTSDSGPATVQPAVTPKPAGGGASTKGNSAAAHEHALEQHKKAQGKALGHTLGKAIGLNDLTPPGKTGDTGAPAHSNAGGSVTSHSPPARVRQPRPPFPPKGNSRGHGR